jgi:hypothetical protein
LIKQSPEAILASSSSEEIGGMSRKTLQEFAREHGQTQAALLLGLTQGSLNKALRVGRDIYVTEQGAGRFTAEELRPFPSQNGPKASTA